MKRCFRPHRFTPATQAIIDRANDIIDEYNGQALTLRQVYYRFIATDTIPDAWIDDEYNRKHHLPAGTKNTIKNYKRLCGILNDGRYAGLIDWAAIEDRGRRPDLPHQWDSIDDLMESALSQFRLPRWDGQRHYVELWVEKQALAGVLEPIADEYHVALLLDKGYNSASAIYESAQRITGTLNAFLVPPKPVILYVGDHDPSGEDMVRDLADRLVELSPNCRRRIEIRKVALTMEQIRFYDPPPNPAKTTDSRYARYAAEHGDDAWEVDAIPPNELLRIVREALESLLDRPAMEEIIAQEKAQTGQLRKALARVQRGRK